MILLDENILAGQRVLLEGWSIGVRQIGLEIGRKGLKDEAVIVLLRQLRQPTFFTRDLGFYSPVLRHERYGIVAMAIGQYEAAAFVRRFLKHPLFDTYSKRAGRVIRIAPSGIVWWQPRRQSEAFAKWEEDG